MKHCDAQMDRTVIHAHCDPSTAISSCGKFQRMLVRKHEVKDGSNDPLNVASTAILDPQHGRHESMRRA